MENEWMNHGSMTKTQKPREMAMAGMDIFPSPVITVNHLGNNPYFPPFHPRLLRLCGSTAALPSSTALLSEPTGGASDSVFRVVRTLLLRGRCRTILH